jgi:uncharacterized damage-inducible protein DinB
MERKDLLRQHMISRFSESEAHLSFDQAVDNIADDLRGKRPTGTAHSLWEVLEHLRITQRDILESTRKTNHVSPEFPAGYWPQTQKPPHGRAWDESASAFRDDGKAMIELIADKATDLFAPMPTGKGRTILRQVLLAADHNAYHLGELVLLRRLLGIWQ